MWGLGTFTERALEAVNDASGPPLRRLQSEVLAGTGVTRPEVGGLLFAVSTLAQRLGVDAEQALRERALALRAEILAAEGVPDEQGGNR